MKIELAKALEEGFEMKTILTTSHLTVNWWPKERESL
jgi:hypothetical protein